MGYIGALRYACAVAALAGLTGCNPPARQSETADLRNKVAALEARISALEAQNLDLLASLSATRAMAKVGLDETEGLRKTLNNNARAANENAVKEMTRRGACGTRLVPIFANDESGRQVGVKNEVIPCTLADLKP